MNGKYWWQSRTIWMSILSIVTAFALAALPVIVQAGPTLSWTTVAAAALAGFGALNIYLRKDTSQPIITGPVQQVGGEQTNIAAVTSTHDSFIGSTQTQASGGVLPADTLEEKQS